LNGNWLNRASIIPSSIVKSAGYTETKAKVGQKAPNDKKVSSLIVIIDRESSVVGDDFADLMMKLLLTAVTKPTAPQGTKYDTASVEGDINKTPNDTLKFSKSSLYSLVAGSIRSKIDNTFPPIKGDITDILIKSGSSAAGGDVVKMLPGIGLDDSSLNYFTMLILAINNSIETGATGKAEETFNEMASRAQAHIEETARRDSAAAYNQANGFSALTGKLEDFIRSKSLKSKIISKKFFDDIAKKLTPAAAQSAVGQQDVKSVIAAGMGRGFNSYYREASQWISSASHGSGVNVDDFEQFATAAANAMKEAFNSSFTMTEYEKYAFDRSGKVEKKKGNVVATYNPSADASAAGKSSAAFAIGCYLHGKFKDKPEFEKAMPDKVKSNKTAASMIQKTNYVVGSGYFSIYKKLEGTGLDSAVIDEFVDQSSPNSVSEATRKEVFKTFYEKFRALFESKCNPGGIISKVFRKYPEARTPFREAPYMIAQIWGEIDDKIVKKKEVSKDELDFHFMYFIPGGNPEPTIGIAMSGFANLVRQEWQNLSANVDKLLIDGEKQKSDPTANNAIVVSEQRYAAEMVDRLIKYIENMIVGSPVGYKHPPEKKASATSRLSVSAAAATVDAADLNTKELAGLSAQQVRINNVGELPNIPIVPNTVIETRKRQEEPSPKKDDGQDKDGGQRNDGGQEVNQGSLFHAFCCGIAAAHVHETKIGSPEPEKPIKLEDDKIKLTDDDERVKLAG